MTEPVRSSKVTIGGVKFNRNEIKETKVKNENGAKTFSVSLKNGVSLEYPQQKPESHAKVFSDEINGSISTTTAIFNLAHGKVKGSKDPDHITLFGNNGTTVDIRGGNGDLFADYVSVRDYYPSDALSPFTPSNNNRIIRDKADDIKIETKNKNIKIDGKDRLEEKIDNQRKDLQKAIEEHEQELRKIHENPIYKLGKMLGL